jgi:hypothetical protein
MGRASSLIRAFVWGIACSISSLATAAQFQVPHSTVFFDAPKGYTQLSVQEIGTKFPSGSGPGFAIGNERRTTTIAYELKSLAVSDEQLIAILPGVAEQMEKAIPGLKWIENGIISLDGRPCIYLEMTSEAKDTDIHNIMLMTPQQSGFLVFNFNSTREEFPAVEAELRKAIESIRRSPPAG